MLCDTLTVRTVKRVRSIRGSALEHMNTMKIVDLVYIKKQKTE